jgi:hypothetical protein
LFFDGRRNFIAVRSRPIKTLIPPMAVTRTEGGAVFSSPSFDSRPLVCVQKFLDLH